MKGGMRGLVILLYKCKQAATQLIKGMKIPHIKRSHPLVFHGTEPAFNLGFAGRGVRLAVAECGANPCGEQLHLFVFIRLAVIEVEYLRAPVLGNR